MIFELQAQEYRSPLPSQPKPPKTPLRPPLPPAPNSQSSLQTLSPSPPSLSPSPPPLALSPPSPAPSLLTRGPCPRLQILPSRSPRPLPPPSSNSSVSRTVEYPPQPLPLPPIPQTPSVTKAAASAPRERHPVTMAEEAAASETSATVAQPAETVAVVGTVNPTEHEKSGITVDATVESTAQGGAESVSVSNGDNAGEASGSDPQKSLEFADELTEKGNTAMKENDFGEAADNFSRALEIRVSRYGELAPECVHTYYKYGCALLYKAQEEADPLADVPKKEDGSQHGSTKDGSMKSSVNAESSTASFSSNIEQDVTSTDQGPAVDDESAKNDQEEDEEDSDAEDLAEADEDESDLDLAWKMLDIARAIVEKHSVNTIEQVDILSALADVALEREDFETSLSDYQKALSILEQLVEPDDRKIADLNFRICLCLEVGSRPQEAIPYCEKATSVCKARLHRLTEEVKRILDSTSSVSESQQNVQTSEFENSVSDKQAEIETLKGLSSELEKKLEDLQQLVLNPKSILSEILGIAAAKAGAKESSPGKVSSSQMATADSSAGFDSPTISTAHTNGSTGVTHLGVVGRGVKRPSNSSVPEASAPKKPSLESTDGKGDGDKS